MTPAERTAASMGHVDIVRLAVRVRAIGSPDAQVAAVLLERMSFRLSRAASVARELVAELLNEREPGVP